MNTQRTTSAADTDTRPWYQYRWPWILISIPAVSMVLGVILITTALNNPAILVVDNYYAEGRGINRSMALDDAALALHLTTILSVENGAVTLQLLKNGLADTNEDALRLFVYHVTDNHRDHEFLMLPTIGQAGVFELLDPEEQSLLADILASDTSWYLEVRGSNNNWRLRERITTPLAEARF